MNFGYGCSICSERLERLPAAQEGNEYSDIKLATTPCGHLFHKYCIEKWLFKDCPDRRLGHCPLCRKVVCRSQLSSLYPQRYEATMIDGPATASGGRGVGDHDHTSCTSTISSLEMKLKKAEACAAVTQEQFGMLRDSRDYYFNRYLQCASNEAAVARLGDEKKALKEKLERIERKYEQLKKECEESNLSKDNAVRCDCKASRNEETIILSSDDE